MKFPPPYPAPIDPPYDPLPDEPRRKQNPYYVMQTPRGSVVVCGEHLITEEIKPGEAHALANTLNMEHRTRMAG